MYSYGPPHKAGQKQDDQHEHTFSSYVRIWDVVLKTYLGRWTIGRSGERGSGISVLPARYDDDDHHHHLTIIIYYEPNLNLLPSVHGYSNLYIYVVILQLSYLPNSSTRAGYDTRSIFKRSLTGLNSEFSFS